VHLGKSNADRYSESSIAVEERRGRLGRVYDSKNIIPRKYSISKSEGALFRVQSAYSQEIDATGDVYAHISLGLRGREFCFSSPFASKKLNPPPEIW
jgi:hypothetical protein